jgi:hypothetical protein
MVTSRVRQHVLQQLRALSDDELIDEMFSRSNPTQPGSDALSLRAR